MDLPTMPFGVPMTTQQKRYTAEQGLEVVSSGVREEWSPSPSSVSMSFVSPSDEFRVQDFIKAAPSGIPHRADFQEPWDRPSLVVGEEKMQALAIAAEASPIAHTSSSGKPHCFEASSTIPDTQIPPPVMPDTHVPVPSVFPLVLSPRTEKSETAPVRAPSKKARRTRRYALEETTTYKPRRSARLAAKRKARQ